MSNIAKAFKSIVSGTNNFCCLCFNIYNAEDLCSKDETIIVRNEENTLMSEIMLTVLGNDFAEYEYTQTMDNICETCAKSLLNSYTFIQTCRSNAKLINNMFDGLNSALQNVMKPENENSLFVSINIKNFSSQLMFDGVKNETPKMALDRFKIISASKTINRKTKGKNKFYIKDSDMLHDSKNKLIFQCKVCLNIFETIWKLRKHFTRSHINKNYECSKLARTNGSNTLTKAQQKVTCGECGQTYNSLNSLKKHQMSHKSLLVCPDCGRTYKTKITYKNHVDLNICKQERRHNPAEAKYTCDHCNKKYTQKMSLRVHIQFEHGNYKAHICEWCGKKFWAQSRLKAHIVKHTQEKNFPCQICERKCVTKESLLYHTRLHTGERPYKCPLCSGRFLSASRRTDHVKRFHAGAQPGLQCEVCHGTFRSAEVLLRHKKIHTEKMTTLREESNPIKRNTTPKHVYTSPQKFQNSEVSHDTINITLSDAQDPH